MDAPLGITFFKKVELYQNIKALDKQLKQISSDPEDVLPDPTWNIEKKVLKWTYVGHRQLGTPLSTGHFNRENKYQLKAFGLEPEDVKVQNITRVLENFVGHGFATHTRDGSLTSGDHNVIYFTREGLLTGEILNELDNPSSRLSYVVWGFLWGHVGAWILLITATIGLAKLLAGEINSVISNFICAK